MGALVEELVADSPAERSGLLKGDVLIGINGEFIDAVPDVLKELAQINPGSTVELRIMRDRQELRINVEAGVRPTP
jgi:S1-C subfamily serine protease